MTSPSTAREDVRPASDPEEGSRPALARATWLVSSAAASLVVFMVAFRPWQGGLIEEWGFAEAWDAHGLGMYTAILPVTMGRPLHVVPHTLGLALSGGGFVGVYLVLGLVALGQMWGTYWALGRLTNARALRLALGLLLALHPWWPAGDLLRFLPAQVAVLASVVWLGAAVRHLLDGRARHLTVVVLAPIIGLLTYQAPAAAILAAAVALVVVVPASNRRRLVLVAAPTGAVAATFVWSVVAAPRLAPGSYEQTLLGGGLPDLVGSLRAVLRTLLLAATGAAVLVAVTALVIVWLGLVRRLTWTQAGVLLAITCAAPLAALVYAATSLHLNDPERVALPIGLTCWLVLAVVAHLAAGDAVLRGFLVGASVLTGLVGGVVGYAQWTFDAAAQQSLIAVADDRRDEVDPGHTLVVADTTGRFGDVYLLLPPFLDIALRVEDGPGTPASICTPDDVPRDHPVAAVFPLATTPSCTPWLTAPGVTRLGVEEETTLGPVQLYSVPTDVVNGS